MKLGNLLFLALLSGQSYSATWYTQVAGTSFGAVTTEYNDINFEGGAEDAYIWTPSITPNATSGNMLSGDSSWQADDLGFMGLGFTAGGNYTVDGTATCMTPCSEITVTATISPPSGVSVSDIMVMKYHYDLPTGSSNYNGNSYTSVVNTGLSSTATFYFEEVDGLNAADFQGEVAFNDSDGNLSMWKIPYGINVFLHRSSNTTLPTGTYTISWTVSTNGYQSDFTYDQQIVLAPETGGQPLLSFEWNEAHKTLSLDNEVVSGKFLNSSDALMHSNVTYEVGVSSVNNFKLRNSSTGDTVPYYLGWKIIDESGNEISTLRDALRVDSNLLNNGTLNLENNANSGEFSAYSDESSPSYGSSSEMHRRLDIVVDDSVIRQLPPGIYTDTITGEISAL